MPLPTSEPLLSVRGLNVTFDTHRGPVRAVRDVGFDIAPGETVALVGESGSGKSTAAMAVAQLLHTDGCRVEGEQVRFQGVDLLRAPRNGLRTVRGKSIGMIFQDPGVALNPVMTIGDQLCEPLQIHLGLWRREAMERAVALLQLVRLSAPEQRLGQYPHNLSGGMRQRVMIAMALACKPALLIADEPTTALDVTVQAQVLSLIDELKAAMGMSVLLITHDLAVVWQTASRVMVMYAGRIVEEGPVGNLLTRPAHPYTRGLLRASSWDSAEAAEGTRGRLYEIRGSVPSPHRMPPGCAFADRCPQATAACAQAEPPPRALSPVHRAACLHVDGATA